MIYKLLMIDNKYDEVFNIGFFSSKAKAEKIAKEYLTQIKGFKDYDIRFHIEAKKLIGFNDEPTTIWIASGWNSDENFNETDVIESNCFINKNDAIQALNEMKEIHNQTEWDISEYTIDKAEWQDGFVRI